jgi:23S rRNA pseudouridine1911/1915/1917 synthase
MRVAGRPAKKSQLARIGDAIEVELDPPPRVLADPALPLDVRLETDQLVIVNKPAGQPSVPVPGSESGTLASALLGRYPEMAAIGYRAREPGLVHRLDTGTSGLLIAARTAQAFERLVALLRAGRLKKRYLAVVESAALPGSGVIDFELMPHPRDSRRMQVARRAGERTARSAETRWETRQRTPDFALVEVEVERALRHQIRAHLAAIGHPIVGDTLYGGRAVASLAARHALHASYIAWEGDATLPRFEIEEPLPAEMAALLTA